MMRFGSAMISAAVVVLLCGCSVKGTMIPVEGPMSQLKPVPTINVVAKSVQSNSGELIATMPDGEVCKGRWSSAAGSGLTVGSASLMGQYGATHLSGFAVSTGTGQNPGQAIATCAKGRTLQLEFVTGAGTAHGYGIGKDSDGNVYRFVF
jgi:hypothetical protein